jgi:hypothetical protein
MSFTTSKKKICRCKRKKLKTSDFCYSHNKKKLYYDDLSNPHKETLHTYDTKLILSEMDYLCKESIALNIISEINSKKSLLNKNFDYTLMGLYDSWNNVNYSDQIYLNNEWWHIDILINIFSSQLNNSNMENPYPIYPNNPFNRIPFHPNDLLKFRERILITKKSINITLKLLLNSSTNIINECYIEALNNHELFSTMLLNILNKNFRFMIQNNKNSQDLYTGIWTFKITPLTNFELLFNKFKNMPYQIYDYGYIIDNPFRNNLKNVLDKLPPDNYDPNNKKFCETL